MNPPSDYHRFRTKPRTETPPQGFVDLTYDPVGQTFVKKDATGATEAIGGGATTASVQAALAAATDPEKADMRESIDLQSTAIGFLDRFDFSTRYAENATLTHNSSLPEIGGNTYQFQAGGSPAPKIVSGALEPMGDSLYYFQNRVASVGGKFNLGLVVEFKRSTVYATAVNHGGFTIGVSEQELVSVGGSIGGISGTNPIHVTIRPDGISDASFYLGAAFTCLNATASGGVFPWNAKNTFLPFGEKMAVLFRIKGDILEVEAVGIGTLYFTHPDISNKVGATTYFFYEPVGPDSGTDYRQTARLFRWWANADELDQLPGYGCTVPAITAGPHRFSGQIQAFPNGLSSVQSANTMAGQATAVYRGGAVGVVAKGAYNRFSGGAWHSEGMVSHDFGAANVGASMQGFMVGAVDSNLNSQVSSTAGAATYPNIGLTFFALVLENGDWETIFLAGQLVGAGTKRIRVTSDQTPFSSPVVHLDSNTTGTPINGVAGFWTIEIRRYTVGGVMVMYSELKANGVLLDARRATEADVNGYVLYGIETTTADAGGVTIDTHMRQVARVNPL